MLVLRAAGGARARWSRAAALTKFAPLVLAPLLRDRTARRPRRGASSALAAGFAALARRVALAPVALGDGLGTFYDRTLGFQADRGSPFSIWGLLRPRPRPQRRLAGGAVVLAVVGRLRPAPPRPGRPSPRSAPRR